MKYIFIIILAIWIACKIFKHRISNYDKYMPDIEDIEEE